MAGVGMHTHISHESNFLGRGERVVDRILPGVPFMSYGHMAFLMRPWGRDPGRDACRYHTVFLMHNGSVNPVEKAWAEGLYHLYRSRDDGEWFTVYDVGIIVVETLSDWCVNHLNDSVLGLSFLRSFCRYKKGNRRGKGNEMDETLLVLHSRRREPGG